MALHLHIGHLKPALGWSRYQDANPLADDIDTAPPGPIVSHKTIHVFYNHRGLSSQPWPTIPKCDTSSVVL